MLNMKKNSEQVSISEDIFDVIMEFEEVVELLKNASDNVKLLKNNLVAGDFYHGDAEEVMGSYFNHLEEFVEQLIAMYKSSEQYAVDAVLSFILMDEMLAGNFVVPTKK